MKEINVSLSNYQVVNRQMALMNVGKCKLVALVKYRDKYNLYEISTMEDLKEVVNKEQNRFYCETLTFYKEK